MTEEVAPEVPGGEPSAGAMLRAARERQGLHIAALAASIKVSPRKLDALENDRWQELPDATFARALAQTVCRTLKIDPRPVLDLLPALGSSSLEAGGTLQEPFRERPGRSEPGFAGVAIRPMVWAAAALMVGALVMYLVPRLPQTPQVPTSAPERAPAAVNALPANAAPVAVPASSVGAEPVSVAASAAVAGVAGGPAPGQASIASASVAAASGNAALGLPVAPTASTAGTEARPRTVVSGGAGDMPAPVLAVSASQPSWVEVRDAKGQTLLNRVVAAGETVKLDGAPPLKVTIGNAAVTQMVYKGQPFDVASQARENVARFVLQ
jgi:cytoskeleton protein RodZ